MGSLVKLCPILRSSLFAYNALKGQNYMSILRIHHAPIKVKPPNTSTIGDMWWFDQISKEEGSF